MALRDQNRCRPEKGPTAETRRLGEPTALTEGESQMTEADRNALRNLGYLQ